MAAKLRKLGGALAAVGGAVLLTGVAPAQLDPGVGFWEGTYRCAQGVTGLRLVVRTLGWRSAEREADFIFYPMGGRAEEPQGRFVVRGAIRDGRMILSPHRWTQRYGSYVMVGLDGDVRGDVYAGRVTGAQGCTTFLLETMASRRARGRN